MRLGKQKQWKLSKNQKARLVYYNYTKRNTLKKDNKKIVNLCSEGPVSTDYLL